MACRERVRRVEANAEWNLRTGLHDRGEMLKTMSDAVALSGGVFEQDAELRARTRAELHALARDLQTLRAERDAVGLARAARTARMHHQIIDAEQQRTLHFF